MDKLKMQTKDTTETNIEKIRSLFPNVITETKDENGYTKYAIDFERLKQELSDDIISGHECYDFTWAGKRASIIEANKPIRKTLRPIKEESKDWENTENLYIEGDNLDVLKLLQESYLNSVKMIYIDPPYNTGKDFIYKDNWKISKDDYLEQTNLHDDQGKRLFQNNESNGRFHSDWCSMIYPRLKLARNLLSEDGVIFISIDDNELYNLKKICDDVFGEVNFVSNFIWFYEGVNDNQYEIKKTHEYILVYIKNIRYFALNNNVKDINVDLSNRVENSVIKNGAANPPSAIELPIGFPSELKSGRIYRSEVKCLKYSDDLIIDDYKLQNPVKVTSGWSSKRILELFIMNNFQSVIDTKNQETLFEIKRNGNIHYIKKRDQSYIISVLRNYGTTNSASKMLRDMELGGFFSFPKPIGLIKIIVDMITKSKNGDIILDFFSGSATTAHAVMQLNAEDGGNRRFIMVQLPEKCKEDSEAYKAGYQTISDIGKERIKRAGEKIKSEINGQNVDTGFRVFRLDTSNMEDIYYSPKQITQKDLAGLENNIKEDRSDLDLLYGIILEWGVPIDKKHKYTEMEGKKVHFYDYGNNLENCSLVACFESGITESIVRQIAEKKPIRAVFRDSCFSSSADKINITEIFKILSPATTVKVI